MNPGKAIVAVVVALTAAQPALGAALKREVRSGQGAGLMPIMAFVSSTCTIYPAKEIAITEQPKHGAAKILKHELRSRFAPR